jgi:DHA2 family multidrug resistance protein
VLLGYTAERAGMVLSPAAFVMMFMMFIAGRTVGKMDPRLMVCIAYIVTALGVFNLSQLDLTSQLWPHHELRMLQVIALPFVFIPISTLNYVGVPPPRPTRSPRSRTSRATWAAVPAPRCSPRSSRAPRRCTRPRWRPTSSPAARRTQLFMDRVKEILIKGRAWPPPQPARPPSARPTR